MSGAPIHAPAICRVLPLSLLPRLVRMLGIGQTNLQDDLIAASRFHRLLRRGREFGTALPPEEAMRADAPDPYAGLHFICLNANIARQFEFIQNAWLQSPKFAGLGDEADPRHRQPPAGSGRRGRNLRHRQFQPATAERRAPANLRPAAVRHGRRRRLLLFAGRARAALFRRRNLGINPQLRYVVGSIKVLTQLWTAPRRTRLCIQRKANQDNNNDGVQEPPLNRGELSAARLSASLEPQLWMGRGHCPRLTDIANCATLLVASGRSAG